MRKLLLLSGFSLIFLSSSISPYQMYLANGEKTDFDLLVDRAQEADVILFGEFHNNAIAHWLQLELTKELFDIKKENLVLGAEMFESDQQIVLNEFLSGTISESSFEKDARLWPNYKTDYKPLVVFAKKNNLDFIATNIPRRYASVTAKFGLDTLKTMFNKHSKMFIAPLPVEFDPELPGYKSMAHEGGNVPGMKYLAQAQAIKDATMAYFIVENTKRDNTFLHYNGAYHSNNYEGIVWYLKKYKPSLKILTISVVEQADISKLEDEYMKLADFIIVVDEDVTKTN